MTQRRPLVLVAGRVAELANADSLQGLGGAALLNVGTASGTVAAGDHTHAEYQAVDATLTALAGVSTAADKLPYFTGADAASVSDFTASGRALVGAASADAQRALLSVGPGMKNRIIGGDFNLNPWQRGSSFTGLTGSAIFTADRWRVSVSIDGVVDVLRTADGPTIAQAGVYSPYCLHFDVTTADASIAAGQYYLFQQRIEANLTADLGFGFSGTRYATLSFWHKHTKTGTYCIAITNAGTTRSYVAEYTQSVSDTWELASLTIPADTDATGWGYTPGTAGMRVFFAVACGSTYHATANTWTAGAYYATSSQVNALDSASNNCKFALVSLERGSVATPFEVRSAGHELALCRRYYRKQLTWVGTSTAHTCFPIDMAATPTITGGGTGFSYATNTTANSLDCYQTTAAAQTLELSAEF